MFNKFRIEKMKLFSRPNIVYILLFGVWMIIFWFAVYQKGSLYNSDAYRYTSEAGFLGSGGHFGAPVTEFMRRPLHAAMMAIWIATFGVNDIAPFMGNFFEMILSAMAIYKLSELLYKNSGRWSAVIYLFSGYSWAYGFSLMSEMSSIVIVSWAMYFALKSLLLKKIISGRSFAFILLMGLLIPINSRWLPAVFMSIGLYEIIFIILGLREHFFKIKNTLFHYFGAMLILMGVFYLGELVYFFSSKYIFYSQTKLKTGIGENFLRSQLSLINDFGSNFVINYENLFAFFKNASIADNWILPILFVVGIIMLLVKIIKTRNSGLIFLLLFFVINWIFFSFYHSDKVVTPLAAPRYFALCLPIYFTSIGIIIVFFIKNLSSGWQNILLLLFVVTIILPNRDFISVKLLKPIVKNIYPKTSFAYVSNPIFSGTNPVFLKNGNF